MTEKTEAQLEREAEIDKGEYDSEKMKNRAQVKFKLFYEYVKNNTPSGGNKQVDAMNSLSLDEIKEFNELNKLLLEDRLFIEPCEKKEEGEENDEFKRLNAKAEFLLWEYRKVWEPLEGFMWDKRDFGQAENIFLKKDGQWVWGSKSLDKGKVPRGMKCKRKEGPFSGSNCEEGYTCDWKELKCVKKGTENKYHMKDRFSKMSFRPKMSFRRKKAGRSRKKKRRKSTKKRRRKRRKRTKKKRRRSRR